jgi:hypothetical protein
VGGIDGQVGVGVDEVVVVGSSRGGGGWVYGIRLGGVWVLVGWLGQVVGGEGGGIRKPL